MNKTIILASFVYPDRQDNFLRFLYKRYKVRRERVFIYDNIDNPKKNILTYKIFLNQGERVDLNEFFPKTIIVHKKKECFYTINALNLLIEKLTPNDRGNIDHKQINVNWEDYQNKMLLSTNNDLIIYNIKRNFS
jgi:hypothetical protein